MQSFWRRFFNNPRVVLGLVWLTFIVAVALAAPVLAPTSPFAIVAKPFLPPFGEFLFGTDSLGRSLLAGLIHDVRLRRRARDFAEGWIAGLHDQFQRHQ